MNREITIALLVNNQEEKVDISYNIDVSGDIQTIYCRVMKVNGVNEQWLHVRTFQLKSVVSGLSYTPLFVDNDNIKNISDSELLDNAQNAIMLREHYCLA